MKLHGLGLAIMLGMAGVAAAQQPRGVPEALANLSSQPASHTAFTFDRDMIAQMYGFVNPDGSPMKANISSVTVEHFKYHEPAFYVPEAMHELSRRYEHARWKHLVDQNVTPGQNASPDKPLTDLWMHFQGMDIDNVTVLIRGPKEMDVIELSGILRPLDFVHLSGHFGIPKVDPGAVMVPAPPPPPR